VPNSIFAPSIRRLSIAALLLFSALAVRAQQPADVARVPHFSLDPQALYQAASAVPAPEGAVAAVLEEDESYSFDEQDRLTHTGHYIYKVLNEKGAEGWDSISVNWAPWHEARPVIRVRVIAPDFSVHALDASAITESPAREGDYKSYSDDKILRAPFPAVAPGVVIEEEYVQVETQPFFAAGRVGRTLLGNERVPVGHSRVTIEAPANLPLRTSTVLMEGVEPVRTEANGRVTIAYDKGRTEGIDPAEPFRPHELLRYPEVRYSTAKSWQALAAEYARIVDSHADTAAVKAIVDPLIAGKKTVAEKEQALIDYLDREVRYTGIEFGEAAIVPHDPAEVLAKKYGDCKDKATLLVTMLRAAGIPAYVALLDAGFHSDVPEDMPGMGLFDHAIVYVPAKPGKGADAGSEVWIDATDRYARLGQLPGGDQGRRALIARAETTGLQLTPVASSRQNVLAEVREMRLSENGPAAVTETTLPQGVFESSYRDDYADRPDQAVRDSLRGYVKGQYVSDNLVTVERSDPADLSKQFQLTIQCDKAKRGYTGLENAQAAIRLEGLFTLLPDPLKQRDDQEEKLKQGRESDRTPRAVDWEMNAAFSADWQYRIVPPAGFIAKELPKDEKIALGPALLTEQFSTDKDGAVLAHLVFDSVKKSYTVAEATELRNKVAEIVNGPAVVVNFEAQGAALLREGKVREALASYRALIALHPNEAVHHLQVATVLLGAGMGQAARDEARQAVKLEPNSALGEKILAEILKCDLVGRQMRAGSDLAGAAEAYRAAAKLDPDDDSLLANLGIVLEYDPVGRRYGPGAKLKEAIEIYRKLGDDKLRDVGIPNILAFAYFYNGQYQEAYKEAQKLNPPPVALIAASVAMMSGSKAGLAEANTRSVDDNAYKETARVAGSMLKFVRAYQQAADFLEAGASGDQAAANISEAKDLRAARRHEEVQFANTPEDAERRSYLFFMDPNATEESLHRILSRSANLEVAGEDKKTQLEDLNSGRNLNRELAREGESMDAYIDTDLAALDVTSEGSDETAWLVHTHNRRGFKGAFVVVKEDGQYKLLGRSLYLSPLGVEVAARVKRGDLKGAKTILDWVREDLHLEGGDDPLGGPVFPRFWTKGHAPDADRMLLAAGVMMTSMKSTNSQALAILEPALNQPMSAVQKANLQLALAAAYGEKDDFASELKMAGALLEQYPDSTRAFEFKLWALAGTGQIKAALALADERVKQMEDDTAILNAKMAILQYAGDAVGAHAFGLQMIEKGKADPGVLNNVAWEALFTGKVDDADVELGVKATQMQPDHAGTLHTLACLYAERGKTKEAHDMVVRAMDMLNLNEPDDNYWYALGRIAEQFGERDTAIADYRKVAKPDSVLEIPTSSWQLAQNRLKAMGVTNAAK
jgi:tetratricopeptide (TPR) repeat protein/transglutaminase-like putative cysteine protease